MDDHLAVTLVSTSAPGVNREAEATLDMSRATLASRMPFRFPVHEPRSDRKFVAINFGVVAGEIDIFEEKVHRIHVELGGEVFQSAVCYGRHLRMIGSAPRASRTDIVQNGGVLIADVRRFQDVRQLRRAFRDRALRAPRVGIPSDKRAVALGGNFYV